MILGIVAGLAVAGALLLEPGRTATGSSADTGAAGADPSSRGLPDTVGIRVLNGTDIPYLASDVQRYLLGRGCRGFRFTAPGQPDNAERPGDLGSFEETVVASHVDDLSAARSIAGLLSLDTSHVVWELDRALVESGVEVTVYLGLDMEEIRGELVPYVEEEDYEGAPPAGEGDGS